MNTALLFLLAVGVLGAFDTIYYREWNLRLPQASFAGRELKLHAARDFVYAILFGSLGWVAWQGVGTPGPSFRASSGTPRCLRGRKTGLWDTRSSVCPSAPGMYLR
jgi:hypothetical protein